MSEDEKKAIEELKKVRWNSLGIVVKNEDGKMDISYFTEKHKKTILNLIEKQKKEIENLKELMAHKNAYTKKLEEDLYENASNYVVSKDKIREKIKELDEKWHVLYRDSEVKDILKELLKEE